jgi:tetratricopeptide (TPR) repeat protein
MGSRLFLPIVCVALAACATRPAPLPPEAYFLDEMFPAPAERVSADDVFTLNDAMKHYVHADIAQDLREQGPARGLVDAMGRRDRLKLTYDSTRTRNAAEAFEARKGNCLSLVIMTAAFAKELGLKVNYESVIADDTWSRGGDLVFLNTHVNLTLGTKVRGLLPEYDANSLLTIDFLPSQDVLGRHTRAISEDRVVAMYMNNRAAEALAKQQLDAAYWWARGSILRDADFPAPYSTLGVVYLHHGDLPSARKVLSHALERFPNDTIAMSNLIVALNGLGRTEEAEGLRSRLAKLEQYPPFHFFWLGKLAMQRGDFQAARYFFRKEVDRADYSSEFHYWLGIAELQLGNIDQAREQLATALENSTSTNDHDLYAAKLERLRSHGVR